MVLRGGAEAHVVAVVAGALVGVAEDVVGLVYALEAGRGLWVGRVVWVVLLGEAVEGSVVGEQVGMVSGETKWAEVMGGVSRGGRRLTS
jgi:hypothetical protein